jgi:hypothetical protein
VARRPNQNRGWRGRKPGRARAPAGRWLFQTLVRIDRRLQRLERSESSRTKREAERAKVQKVVDKLRHEAFMDRMKRSLFPRRYRY